MGIFNTVYAQARAWYATSALASENEQERKRAMQTLRDLGTDSLPSLHAAIRRTGAPRAQFAAAVVLHWLGDPVGMSTLIDGLTWQLSSTPQLARELESCFIAIGAPDAVTELMKVWKRLKPTKDNRRVYKSICRVWAALRDPRPLAILAESALQYPELFEEYVPAFGESALLVLEPMSRDDLPARRSLAVRVLRHINAGGVATLLFPLLRDPDVSVRAIVPQALDALKQQRLIFEADIYAAILNALDSGFSTPQAITTLLRHAPPPVDALLALVLRWNGPTRTTGDTLDAVLTALPALAHTPLYSSAARSELRLQMCRVLERRPEPALMSGIARVLAARGKDDATIDAQIVAVLFALLPHPDTNVRTETARALDLLGEPVGKQLLHALETAWPQANLRDKFQALLRGGSDASQVANHAVQWFTRVSKETVERWSTPAIPRPNNSPASTDTRLPALLRQLLDSALSDLPQTTDAEQTEQTLELCVACIRALVPFGSEAANCAQAEMLCALNTCKSIPGKMAFNGVPSRQELRVNDAGEVVRYAAGQALLALYGQDSFPLFAQALYAPQIAVRVTAIAFLGELGDVRALPLLQPLAAQNDPLLSPCAQEALSRIRQLHPETMTLLRASSVVDSRPDTLLRPVFGNTDPTAPDTLLRPTTTPLKINRPRQ